MRLTASPNRYEKACRMLIFVAEATKIFILGHIRFRTGVRIIQLSFRSAEVIYTAARQKPGCFAILPFTKIDLISGCSNYKYQCQDVEAFYFRVVANRAFLDGTTDVIKVIG